ncbi:MAG: hypothetical protein [Podoviridae sp. ctQNx1]|nr:MAG: hypothetical protein [Podoviridae sp. ctQNx1]UOF78114.1 hypothetical protein [Caudoviricetes sp.]
MVYEIDGGAVLENEEYTLVGNDAENAMDDRLTITHKASGDSVTLTGLANMTMRHVLAEHGMRVIDLYFERTAFFTLVNNTPGSTFIPASLSGSAVS